MAAFQSRPLKLGFLEATGVLMLSSLGGYAHNPSFLTRVEILPAAPKQVSTFSLLLFEEEYVFKIQQVCSKYSLNGCQQWTVNNALL